MFSPRKRVYHRPKRSIGDIAFWVVWWTMLIVIFAVGANIGYSVYQMYKDPAGIGRFIGEIQRGYEESQR